MLELLPVKLFIALLFGAAIGLEREGWQDNESSTAGGIRTFSLVGLLGGLAGVFYTSSFPVFILVSGVFSALLVSYYILGSWFSKRNGLTTEMSVFYTFLIGFLASTNIIPLQLTMAIFVVVMVVLAFKSKTKEILSGVSRHELESFISYAIIALVILPFLPNVGYTLSNISFLSTLLQSYGVDLGQFANLELLNPRKIWMVVVLVTGIDVVGYLLSKFVGSKSGFTLTSFIAGFVSSTSTTQSLAQKSKKLTVVNYLVGAAVLANLASFLQIFLLVGPLNGKWLVAITPTLLLIMAAAAVMSAFFLVRKETHKKESNVEKKEQKIFSLIPAVKFAMLLIMVKLITKISLILFGQSGFLISSIIASFAGIDAIVINLADMAGKTITFQFALLTFILVNATNLLSKSVYSYLQGSRQFALKFFASVIIIIASSFIGLLLV